MISRKTQVPKQPQPANILLNPFHTGDQPQKRHQEPTNASGMAKRPTAPAELDCERDAKAEIAVMTVIAPVNIHTPPVLRWARAISSRSPVSKQDVQRVALPTL